MTLRHCSHGEILGTGCTRCDQMARAIRGEERPGDDSPPGETREEQELRRGSRWPEWTRRAAGRRA